MMSSTRPRRAVAQKQRQYRFEDSESEEASMSSTVQSSSVATATPQKKKAGSKKKYGGVLASLSNNVSQQKQQQQPKKQTTNKNIQSGGEQNSNKSDCGFSNSYGETITTPPPKKIPFRQRKNNSNEGNLMTTPPPDTVVIGGTMEVFSPPTCAFDRKKKKKTVTSNVKDKAGDNKNVVRHEDEGDSAINSCVDDVLPPAANHLSRKLNPSEASESNDEEREDDDATAEMITPRSPKRNSFSGLDFIDPNETILEDEEREDDDESDEDDDESDEMSESESEEEEEDDEEAYGSEDDEYVPEDDDDSRSEDELSDYVVKETRQSRGRRPQREITERADVARKGNNKKENIEKKRNKPRTSTSTIEPPKTPASIPFDEAPSSSTQSPVEYNDDDDDTATEIANEDYADTATRIVPKTPIPFDEVTFPSTPIQQEDNDYGVFDDDDDDADTQIEATPARNILKEFGSPESLEAIVIEDDDVDDNEDVLIATVINDDEASTAKEVDENISTCVESVADGGDEFESIPEEKPLHEHLESESKSVVSADVHDIQEDEERSTATVDDDDDVEEERTDIVMITEEDDVSALASPVVNDSKTSRYKDDGTENENPSNYLAENAPPSEPAELLFTPKEKKASRKSFYRKDGKIRRGKWSLGSKIGIGSFGVVHVGMNTLDGTLMAVKRFKMDGSVTKDIRREVELLRSLDHKNIVRYLGAEMDKKYLHIFQEWVPGGSVATLLGKFGPFSLQVIRSYLSQSLAGLAYLHDNDIMHRDIKGSNILVNDEGVVKLADFGASKKLSNLQDNLMMSMTVRGTPYFMAPEVFEEKYSAKADVWGIGCVAFQMITGLPPWKDKGFDNPISLFNHIKRHEGPPPMKISRESFVSNGDKKMHALFQNLVEQCFQKDPSARPTVQELMENPFFVEMHVDCDDDASRYGGLLSPGGLFSPQGTASRSSIDFAKSPIAPNVPIKSSGTPLSSIGPSDQIGMSPSPLKQSPSPLKQSPSPLKVSRNKSVSVVQWRTSFLSPPRPNRSSSRPKGTPSPARPTSTRKANSPIPDTSDWPDWAIAELQKTAQGGASQNGNDADNLSVAMGSLALSDDSTPVGGANPFARGSGRSVSSVDKSRLEGLHFLDQSNCTYEI